MEVWKVRCKKRYKGAHNHIVIGQVADNNSTYIKIQGVTLHFESAPHSVNEIMVGKIESRIIPWSNVEIVNLLDQDFDFMTATLDMKGNGDVVFSDGKISCSVCKRRAGY